jgi:hypothetical protein
VSGGRVATVRERMKGTVKKNVDPKPGSLSTEIWPFIKCTSWREIARPKPVPPKRRVVDMSA